MMLSVSPSRLDGLDVIRGLAALWVLCFHYLSRFHGLYGDPNDAVGWWFPDGLYGVDVFFLLSGYVIARSMQVNRTWRQFAFLRLVRLAPTFWVCTSITALVTFSMSLSGRSVSFVDFLGNLTLVPGLVGAQPVDGVSWSIQVELSFYALLAFLIAAGHGRQLTPAMFLWIIAAVATPTPQSLPEISPWILEKSRNALYVLGILPHAHLFVGGVTIRLMEEHKRPFIHSALLAMCLIAAFKYRELSYVLFGVVAWLTIFVTSQQRIAFSPPKSLVWLGAISYPLYLLHQNIGYVSILALERVGAPRVLAIGVAATIALALAHAVHHRIELPAIHWARRRNKSESDARSTKP